MTSKMCYLASGGMLATPRPVSIFTVEGGDLQWARGYNVNCSLDALIDGGCTLTPLVAMTPERCEALRDYLEAYPYRPADFGGHMPEIKAAHDVLRAMLDEMGEQADEPA